MKAVPAGTRRFVDMICRRRTYCRMLLSAFSFFLLVISLLFSSYSSTFGEMSTKVLLPSAKAQGNAPRGENDTFRNYISALEKVGCQPVIVSSGDQVDYDSIDGVLLPGGADINPAFLNQKAFTIQTGTDPAFDRYELEIIREAWERNMPILGICRGAQLINVFRGGTLYGDLPSEKGIQNGVFHRDPRTKKETYHIITVLSGTLLHQILERPVKIVNSHHHHAAKDFGDGLMLDALAPDGVIEAFHAPDRTFCLCVQFHPERLVKSDKLFVNIFQRFHEETVKYRKAREAGSKTSFMDVMSQCRSQLSAR
ncbi:MAG: gamma-glutamyl-gamma-aminobutyrate hydrolase family protein [Vulcanimicrobiota bacterium]